MNLMLIIKRLVGAGVNKFGLFTLIKKFKLFVSLIGFIYSTGLIYFSNAIGLIGLIFSLLYVD